jgi:3-oxosteroid 1-dehydrogenase
VDEAFDFVIVGSGGGAMCAALLMRSVGRNVVILEKTEFVGGTTSTSGGVMWIPNNRFMKAEGIQDSYEKAMTYLEGLVGNAEAGSTKQKKHAYVTEGPRMVDFLVNQGIKLRRIRNYPDYYDDAPGGSPQSRTVIAELFNANQLGSWKDRIRQGFRRMPAGLDEMMEMGNFRNSWKGKLLIARVGLRMMKAKLLGQRWVNAGECLQGRMLQALLNAGVDIRTDARVTELLTDVRGRVTGVAAQIDGQERRIEGKSGVLVNAGGFARNQRMRDKYQPGTSVAWTSASPGDTGEMIEEMMRIGAAIAQMEEMVGSPTMEQPDLPSDIVMRPGAQTQIAKPHAILVDQSGVRYMRESISYMEICQRMFSRNKDVPAVPSWMICDSQYLSKYMLSYSLPTGPKPQSWFDSGFLRRGETIKDLARACSLDPAALKATVDRYNGFVRNGRDEDFHRGERAYDSYLGDPNHSPSATLGAIDRGPFYGVQVFPGDVSTYGGVVTDEFARVLREDGSVIEGLYSTGTSTASVMGRFYPGAGSSVGPSYVFGYIAAKHAANASNEGAFA